MLRISMAQRGHIKIYEPQFVLAGWHLGQQSRMAVIFRYGDGERIYEVSYIIKYYIYSNIILLLSLLHDIMLYYSLLVYYIILYFKITLLYYIVIYFIIVIVYDIVILRIFSTLYIHIYIYCMLAMVLIRCVYVYTI